MQNQNWRLLNRITVVSTVAVLVISFSAFAMAQGKGAASVAMFAKAAKDSTSVAGVRIIADRPKGFNPLTASSEELGKYGLPPRPDSADVKGLAHWQKAMAAIRYRGGDVKAMPYSSRTMMAAKQQPAAATAAGSATPSQYLATNWSGVANTNTLKQWNKNTSFDLIESIWNVPAVAPPNGACENGITGTNSSYGFYQVSWNGIDGFFGPENGTVLQGGTLGYADCGGPVDNFYAGWVEWYPSYPILEIFCDYGNGYVPCIVNAGDDFEAVTFGANSGYQYVFVEDINQGWYIDAELTWLSGPLLIGASEEQIVERPCCDGDGYALALADYIFDMFIATAGEDGKGTIFYGGEQTPATAIISMVDDADDQNISDVLQGGGTGFQGRYTLTFETVGCAAYGGCASDAP